MTKLPENKKILKVALIGIGEMGGGHYNAYKNITGAKLVAVCDIRKEVAEEKTYEDIKSGSDIKIYTDYKKMIESETLDMIDMVTPSYLHAEIAEYCLDKGLNVLVEKPMALSKADCNEMINHAIKSGKKLMVAHVVRFMKPYMFLADTIKEGKYGKLISLDMSRVSSIPTCRYNDWMRDEKLSGGVCIDLAVHDIDFIQNLLGKPDKISSIYRPITNNSSFIKYNMIIDGVSVTGKGTWFNADIPFSAEFLAVFENGYLEYKSGKLILNKSEVELEESKVNFGGLNISGDNAYANEIQYFINCVLDNKAPDFVSPESSEYSIELAKTILKKAEIIG